VACTRFWIIIAGPATIENSTGRDELAVADGSKLGVPSTTSAIGTKVIAWGAFPTAKLRETAGAGLKVELPTWLAKIVTVPAPVSVIVPFEAVA
jgi:hypothetical protein